jgi:2,5-diketo-D-gluconate reductase B
VAKVVLRWLVQQPGVVALSRTIRPERTSSSLDAFGFELSPDDMAAIHELAAPYSRIVDPTGLASSWTRRRHRRGTCFIPAGLNQVSRARI